MHVVVIGNGIAGNSAASQVRRLAPSSEVTIISEEKEPLYSACALAYVISGDITRDKVFIKSKEDYQVEGIETIFGQKVLKVDTKRKQVVLKKEKVNYDRLVIATGSKPISPSIEGVGKKGITSLKTLADADFIASRKIGKAVVIGSGLIGVEACLALRNIGWQVTLIELLDWILPRVFDQEPAQLIERLMRNAGVDVFTKERLIRILGGDRVEGVMTNKRDLRCDMVVLAVGMKPEVELAKRAGAQIGKCGGIRTNSHLQTSLRHIYACGDCVESQDIVTGEKTLSLLWPTARQQGDVVGSNCVGIERKYQGSLNITGFHIFDSHAVSVGHNLYTLSADGVKMLKSENGYYSRLLLYRGKLVGAQFVGKTEELGHLVSVIRRGESLERIQYLVSPESLNHNPWNYKLRLAFGKGEL